MPVKQPRSGIGWKAERFQVCCASRGAGHLTKGGRACALLLSQVPALWDPGEQRRLGRSGSAQTPGTWGPAAPGILQEDGVPQRMVC